MIPFPWLETQPLAYALCIVLTLVEAIIVVVVGMVLCLTAVLPESCSNIDKSDRIFYVRLGLILTLLGGPAAFALGLYLNAILLLICSIGLGVLAGRSILLAFGK